MLPRYMYGFFVIFSFCHVSKRRSFHSDMISHNIFRLTDKTPFTPLLSLLSDIFQPLLCSGIVQYWYNKDQLWTPRRQSENSSVLHSEYDSVSVRVLHTRLAGNRGMQSSNQRRKNKGERKARQGSHNNNLCHSQTATANCAKCNSENMVPILQSHLQNQPIKKKIHTLVSNI